MSVLKAVGRSDYVLRLEIIKKIIGVFFILLGLYIWGIWGILYALALNSFIEIFLNGYYLNKELNYSGLDQLLDMLPSIIISSLSGLVSYVSWICCFPKGYELIAVLISSVIFIICYLIGSWIGHLYGFEVLKKGVAKIIRK